MTGKDLRLAVKREYFYDIKSGRKINEFRRVDYYWKKRLLNVKYDTVTITLGYPKKGDKEREMIFPYRGCTVECINHKHFGDRDVVVFSIPVGRHPAIAGGV